MKPISLSAAAIVALAGLGATPVLAKAEPEVRIDYAVARVVVIVEDRRDIAVEIEQGTSGLPALRIERRGDEVRIDGGLSRRVMGRVVGDRIESCRSGSGTAARPGDGAWAQVRDIGRINLSDAPMIVIRAPREVDVTASGAVYGTIGRGARAIELGNAGCGDWNVANTDGKIALSVAGSGDVQAGTSSDLDVSIGGSGSVTAGETRRLEVSVGGSGAVSVADVRGPSEISIGGSGDVRVASVRGPTSISVAGSGDVVVRAGSAPELNVSVAGSGNVNFGGTAGDVDVALVGGGDVRIAQATGQVSRNIMGGGDVTIGR